MFGELVDGIAAIKQDAFVAVDEGDVAFAARRRREAGIVGEDVGLGVKLSDVHDVGTDRAGEHGKVVRLAFVSQGRRASGNSLALSHRATPMCFRRP